MQSGWSQLGHHSPCLGEGFTGGAADQLAVARGRIGVGSGRAVRCCRIVRSKGVMVIARDTAGAAGGGRAEKSRGETGGAAPAGAAPPQKRRTNGPATAATNATACQVNSFAPITRR